MEKNRAFPTLYKMSAAVGGVQDEAEVCEPAGVFDLSAPFNISRVFGQDEGAEFVLGLSHIMDVSNVAEI